MLERGIGQPSASAATTLAGVDHVLLAYRYLDAGDLDAYGSLFDDDAQVNRPDAPFGHGRRQLLDRHAALCGTSARHQIYKVIADGDTVAVTGRFTPASGDPRRPDPGVDFADFFTLSADGLLLGYRRFYFAAPPSSPAVPPAPTRDRAE